MEIILPKALTGITVTPSGSHNLHHVSLGALQ